MKDQNILPPRNISAKIIKNPILPILKYLNIAFSGKKDATIFEPSRGGMGMKLNIARNMLILIAYIKTALITPKNVI